MNSEASREQNGGGMERASLMTIPEGWDGKKEYLNTLLVAGDMRIERIISRGHRTPDGEWYDQDTDEWVSVLQGEARLAFDDQKILVLRSGDWILIKAHQRHRVEQTSHDPLCIWLTVHYR